MTFKQVAAMIRSIRIPFAYYQFPEGTAQEPPFICYFYSGDNDLKADNSNYQKIEHLNIELYTNEKDFDAEATVETALKNAGLVWSRSEDQIDSERLYMVVYELDIMITQEANNGTE